MTDRWNAVHLNECGRQTGGNSACFFTACRCVCHESDHTREELGAYGEGNDTVHVTTERISKGSDEVAAAVRFVKELGRYKAAVLPPSMPPVLLDLVVAADQEREFGVNFGFKTYGTMEQVRETAERVRQYLSVELHQEVVVLNGPYDLNPGAVNSLRSLRSNEK